MRRKAYKELIKWMEKSKKVCVIRGAKGVGKTCLAQEFGKDRFEKTAYVDCRHNERMELLFKTSSDSARLKTAMQIETGVSIDKDDTLIIFDNIDSITDGEKIISYFNHSGYYVIGISTAATGEKDAELHELVLTPLSFSEYVEARGLKDLADLIFTRDWDLKKVFYSKYKELLYEYIFVGGMPECVNTFNETGDFARVRYLQRRILADYEVSFFDFERETVVKKMTMLYNSVPEQLVKDNNKFVYDKVKAGARAKEFEQALELLIKSGAVLRVNRMTKPSMMLWEYPSHTFKMFLNDIGLLSASLKLDMEKIKSESIFTEYNGAIAEQFVLQQLMSTGTEPRYWAAYKGTSKMDFLVEYEESIIPVETVGTENKKSKNMKVYLEKFQPKRALRLSLSDYRNDEGFINIPIFAAESVYELCSGDLLIRK